MRAKLTKLDINSLIGKETWKQREYHCPTLYSLLILCFRTDPDRDYTYYDLTKDADHVLSGTNRRARHSFSRVKHYPPNRLDMMKRRKRKLEERIQASKNVFNSVVLIETGNLSAKLRKDEKKAKKRDYRGSIFGSKSNSAKKGSERSGVSVEKSDRSGSGTILGNTHHSSSRMPSIVENEDWEKE